MNKKKIFQIAIPVFAVLFGVYSYVKYNVPPKIEFLELTTTDLYGQPISIDEYAGKNIFITMWAPWCRDCIAEMPALEKLKGELASEGVVFLAISGYDIAKELKFKENNPYSFQYLHMSEKLKEIGVHSIPTNYIINDQGKVVYEKVGADTWEDPETVQMIKELIK